MGDTRDLLTETTKHFYTMSIDEPTSYGLASIHVFGEQGSRMTYEDCQFLSFPRSALSRRNPQRPALDRLLTPPHSHQAQDRAVLAGTEAVVSPSICSRPNDVWHLHCPMGKLGCCLKDISWGSCENKTTAHQSPALPRAVVHPDPVNSCHKNATRAAPT